MNLGTRKTRLSLIIGSQNSMEKKIFLPIHVTFTKNVKFSRITWKNWVFSSSSHITSDWKSTIRGRRGKNFLAVYVTWNKKKLLVNSKKLTLKKDFSKEEKNVCQKKLLSFQTKRRCFSKKKKPKNFFAKYCKHTTKIAMWIKVILLKRLYFQSDHSIINIVYFF